MRILITNTGPWGTGSFVVADALVKEFTKLGHEVVLFFPDSGLPSELQEFYHKQPGIYRIWSFPQQIGSHLFPSFPLIIPDPHPRSHWEMTYKDLSEEMLQAFMTACHHELAKLIEEFQPDVIECQHLWMMNYHLSQMDVPLFCTAHHSDQMGFRYDTRMQPYVLESLKKVQKVFTISHFVKEEVIDLYSLLEKEVVVFPNGYDETLFFPKEVDKKAILNDLCLDIPPDAKLVSFAGKISETKGLDILLQASLMMKRDDIHFVVLGGGDFQAFKQKHFSDTTEFKQIHFLGHRAPTTVAKVHNISHISTLPSRSEGFGIACLEAMACGLPLVMTHVGGLKEFGIGTFVEPENPMALAKAITEMIDLPEEKYRALSKSAIQKAKEFSWEKIARDRLSHYEQVLKTQTNQR